MSLGISYAGYRNGFPGKVHHAMEDGTPFSIFDFSGTPAAEELPPAHTLGPGTYHPVGLSLSEAAELYWRVKEHRFVSALEWLPDISTPPAVALPIDSTKSIAATHEVEMIPGVGSFVPALIEVDSFTMYDSTETAYFIGSAWSTIGYYYPGGVHEMRFFDGLYWPHINFGVETDAGVGPIFYTGSLCVGDFSGGIWKPESAATMDFHGHTLKLYEDSDMTTTGTATVSASEYWGYGGKFNTTTGARI